MFVEAALLGAVQALTEFLPVSSSAHLLLVPEFAGWSDPLLFSLTLSVALHVGTALALAVALWRDWWWLAKGVLGRNADVETARRVATAIVGSTVIVGAVAYPLQDKLIDMRTVLIAAIMLIVFGTVLAAVDRLFPARRTFNETHLSVWLIVGMSQLAALVPGVSRSGITMTAARALGVERRAATRFSLMLLAPIALAIGAVQFSSVAASGGVVTNGGAILVGTLSAALIGFVVVRGLLWFVNKHSFFVFGAYRVVLGITALVVLVFQP